MLSRAPSSDLPAPFPHPSRTLPAPFPHPSRTLPAPFSEPLAQATARRVVLDAKTDYPVACNAAETLLLHASLLSSPTWRGVAQELIAAGARRRRGRRTHPSRPSHASLTPLSRLSRTSLSHLSHTSLSHLSHTSLSHLSHTSHTPLSHTPHTHPSRTSADAEAKERLAPAAGHPQASPSSATRGRARLSPLRGCRRAESSERARCFPLAFAAEGARPPHLTPPPLPSLLLAGGLPHRVWRPRPPGSRPCLGPSSDPPRSLPAGLTMAVKVVADVVEARLRQTPRGGELPSHSSFPSPREPPCPCPPPPRPSDTSTRTRRTTPTPSSPPTRPPYDSSPSL